MFDPKEAVAPFSGGRYKVEQYRESRWISVEDWELKPSDDGYILIDQKLEQSPVWLFELSSDTFIIDVSRGGDHQYGIARVEAGAIVVSGVDCSTYLGSDTAKKYAPVRDVGGYVSRCYFDDNQKLFGAIGESTKLAQPILRLTAVLQQAEGVSVPPQTEANKSLTSLTLCNNSPLTVSAILLHQNRVDASKRMLSGWYEIERHQCRDVGMFPRNDLFVYGRASQGMRSFEWKGETNLYCVTQRRTYRVVRDNERCVVGEVTKPFAKISATFDAAKYTFGWSGPR
ncbi:DUF1036 domain-containing protein [Bradyrhizobium sp. HKCCYLS20291]|uniref:DUF1036 domain-containing protein n=1 Tax=Bradyrhizobium sp. HKCCYLS20291 TaxID=3420766 RepID=UPI003EC0639E